MKNTKMMNRKLRKEIFVMGTAFAMMLCPDLRAAEAAAANPVKNPGFEEPAVKDPNYGWAFEAHGQKGSKGEIQDKERHSGKSAAMIAVSQKPDVYATWYQRVKLSPNEIPNRISLWHKNSESFTIIFHPPVKTPGFTVEASAEWKNFVMPIDVPADSELVIIELRATKEGEFFFDDVSLTNEKAVTPAAKNPSILFAGPCGYEMASRLIDAGFAVNGKPQPGNENIAGALPRLKRNNVVVIMGMGLANADMTLTEEQRKLIAGLDRFMESGGGVLIIPGWAQMRTGIPAQDEFLKSHGLSVKWEEVIFDAETSVNATPWKIDFARTDNIHRDDPLTRDVATLWYPSATRVGAQTHSFTFTTSPQWQVPVAGSSTAKSRKLSFDSMDIRKAEPQGSFDSNPPLVAYRQVGKGRLAVLGVSYEYIFRNAAFGELEGIFLQNGLKEKKSDGARLVLNTLNWLAEPSRNGSCGLGGAETDKTLLEKPGMTKFGRPFNWAADGNFPAVQRQYPGMIGARTAFSSGKGTVAEWATAAKAAGLSWLVFLEDFASLSSEEFEKLKKDCAAVTKDGFAAIPGFEIEDEIGNHYYYFGTLFGYPSKKLLDPEGKKFASFDVDSINPPVKGQLAMTTLTYAYTDNGFKLTAGNFSFRKGSAPFANYYSSFDSMAVVTAVNNKTVETVFDDFLALTDVGQAPVPLAIDLMDAPSFLASSPWRTLLGVSGNADVASSVTAYWNEWHFFQDNPARPQVSSGPVIENWSYAGSRDYDGMTKGDFVWQNYRWRLHGSVSSAKGLKEIKVMDGTELFRRYLPNGVKTFSFELDITHDKQHNLVLFATDIEGGFAVSGEQLDRNHRKEEFNCADRMNQLGHSYQTNSAGIGIWHGAQTTPNKRVGGGFGLGGGFGGPGGGDHAFDGDFEGGVPGLGLPVPMCLRSGGREIAAPPAGVDARRLLHSGDISMGEGRYAWNFLDGIPVRNVWHTMWKMEPAKDFEITRRGTLFQIDPDALVSVGFSDYKLTLLRDINLDDFLLAYSNNGTAKTWAIRDKSGKTISGNFASSTKPDQPAEKKETIEIGLGSYLAFMRSKSGIAVFPLNDGIKAVMQSPVNKNRNLDLIIPKEYLPKKAGESISLRFLGLGFSQLDPNTSLTDLMEKCSAQFGLGADGKALGYSLDLQSGKVIGQRMILEVDGSKSKCLSGKIKGDLMAGLPVKVSGLNDRWSAMLLDRKLKKSRPVAVFENAAWAVLPLHGENDLFIGHPVFCENPELFIQTTQTGETEWNVEIHNPTDQAVDAKITANPFFDPLSKNELSVKTFRIAAGASVFVNLKE